MQYTFQEAINVLELEREKVIESLIEEEKLSTYTDDSGKTFIDDSSIYNESIIEDFDKPIEWLKSFDYKPSNDPMDRCFTLVADINKIARRMA